MKILFYRKKAVSKNFWERLSSVLFLTLLVTVVFVQVSRLCNLPEPVAVSAVARIGQIELSVEGANSSKNLSVLVNGEEKEKFHGGKAQVSIKDGATIEIFNKSEKDVRVKVSQISDNIREIDGNRFKNCQKGINYIGRFYCTEALT